MCASKFVPDWERPVIGPLGLRSPGLPPAAVLSLDLHVHNRARPFSIPPNRSLALAVHARAVR